MPKQSSARRMHGSPTTLALSLTLKPQARSANRIMPDQWRSWRNISITLKMATGDDHLLLMRGIGRVVVGDQAPAPVLLYPHSGKASVVGDCLVFILPIHC